MAELLENSDNTNVDTGVSESPANEATISLAAVQALADALQKIESYTPTVWVDNESPDIDAAHLNKAEQAIMRVTTAMNSAVDVIKDLQSQVNTTNNNLSNSGIPIVKKITDLYSIKASGFYYYDTGATNAPISSRGGMVIANYLSNSWISLNVVPYASSKIYTNTKYNNTWVGWAESSTKDDLGVTEYNAGKSISISGKLSDIGTWLQTNGVTSRWMSARVNPTNDGYFGRSTFCILWQCSSVNYGWCILISDNSKMVVFGRNSEGWHWYAPSLTEVS